MLKTALRKDSSQYSVKRSPGNLGLDLDSPLGLVEQARFTDLVNYRIVKPGKVQVREGYREFYKTGVPREGPLVGTPIPVAKAEYAIYRTAAESAEVTDLAQIAEVVTRYDVTAVWEEGSIYLIFLDKGAEEVNTGAVPLDIDTIPGPTKIVVTVCSGIVADENDEATWPVVDMTSFRNSLIVTVFGDAVYEVYPNDVPPTAFQVEMIGKDLAPTPVRITYAPSVVSDLFVYEPQNLALPTTDKLTGGISAGISPKTVVLETLTDPGAKEPRGFLAKAKVTSYLSDTDFATSPTVEGFGSSNFKRWEFNDKHALRRGYQGNGPRTTRNPRTNAWGYRFDIVRKKKRTGNQRYVVHSHASVDVWVRNSVYVTPHLSSVTAGVAEGVGQLPAVSDSTWTRASNPILTFIDLPEALATTHTAIPSQAALTQFRDELLKFLDKSAPTVGADWSVRLDQVLPDVRVVPYLFALGYAGMRYKEYASSSPDIVLNGNRPYRIQTTAYDMKMAPLVEFNWADFQINDSSVEEIRVFRTAYAGTGDPLDAIQAQNSSLLYQPNTFGYVGSIKPNGSFLDDVKDTDIQFGIAPEQSDGYLQGQFSGQKIREYQQKLVLANTKTTYRVFQPTSLVQAFPCSFEFTSGTPELMGGYDKDDDFGPLPGFEAQVPVRVLFHYSYVDEDGNESDLTDIVITTADCDSFSNQHVIFLLALGYDPFITGINLYRSTQDTSGGLLQARQYELLKRLTPEDTFYLSTDNPAIEPALASSASRPGGQSVDYYEGAEIMWSETNSVFHWPPLNVEREHQFAPITNIDVILGELWVQTPQSTGLTRLNPTEKPFIEEEARYVGCISRFASQKVDKVLFFLSQNGLYFAEGSGVVQYPAHVQSEVEKYLREQIPGRERFANARRATMGYIGHRQELFLHFPSSYDLWPDGKKNQSLPQLTLVYKFLGGDILKPENYRFDLTLGWQYEQFVENGTAIGYTPSPTLKYDRFRSERVLFGSQPDGSLFSACYDKRATRLSIVNMDYAETPWPGWAAWEKVLKNDGLTPLQLRALVIAAKVNARARIYTGAAPYDDSSYGTWAGHIHPNAQPWPVTVVRPERLDFYWHTGNDSALESKATHLFVRMFSEPATNGAHTLELSAFAAAVSEKHYSTSN